MVKEYTYIKVINILYSVVQFIFIYFAAFFIDGPLYKNWFSVVIGVFIIVLIIGTIVFLNLLMKCKIEKKYNNFDKNHLLWMIIPLGLLVIQIINIVL